MHRCIHKGTINYSEKAAVLFSASRMFVPTSVQSALMAVTIVLLISATGLSRLPLSDTEHQLFRQAIGSPFRVEMTLSSVGEVATVQGYCISSVILERQLLRALTTISFVDSLFFHHNPRHLTNM